MRRLRPTVLVVAGVLLLLFVVQNTEVVTLTFLFWQFPLSRALFVFILLAIGFFLGLLVGWRRQHRPGPPR
ncbi:MAG: LapA family protein [Pseudomonadota bacterium]|nr:LapA family protein [Pseudomonadota bacterium]